jgi:outer membrane immunogenic protein
MIDSSRRLLRISKFSLLCATSAIAISASADARAWDTLQSGFYAGLHAGAATGTQSGTGTVGPYSGALVDGSSFGALFGGQVGYDFVAGSGLVLGAELSASAGHVTDSNVQTNFAGSGEKLSYDRDLSSLVLAQGKLGWANGTLAIYGLGGAAFANGEISGSVSDSEGFSGTSGFKGWTLGFGAEWAATQNVSVGAVYNYVNLTADSVTGKTVTIDQALDSHIAKLVLNYHF